MTLSLYFFQNGGRWPICNTNILRVLSLNKIIKFQLLNLLKISHAHTNGRTGRLQNPIRQYDAIFNSNIEHIHIYHYLSKRSWCRSKLYQHVLNGSLNFYSSYHLHRHLSPLVVGVNNNREILQIHMFTKYCRSCIKWM